MDEQTQSTAFTDKERQLIGYIETEWFLRGVKPTPETLCTKFNLTPKALNTFLSRPEVGTSLTSRGIPVIQGRDLSPEQITAINLVLNLNDTRSERKKLSDSGITPKVWEGWKQDPKVRDYIAQRSELILDGAIPDAHLALVERVRSGDMGALKFYYEMTGRYTGQNAGMDPKVLLTKVFDIIAKHVTNPVVLQAIASEFQLLAGLDRAGNLNTRAPVAGEVVQGEISPVARF